MRAKSKVGRRDDGSTTETLIELEVRMHNKVAALELLGRYLGLFGRA